MRKAFIASALTIGLVAVPMGAALAAKAETARTRAEASKTRKQEAKAKDKAARAKEQAAKEQAAKEQAAKEQAAKGGAASTPAETQQAPIVGSAEAGSKIFENICSHCHRLDYQTSVVGAPGLRDITHRQDVKWINQWITSPSAFAKINSTAKALVDSNPYGLTMPTLPEMQDPQNRADIIAFLKTLEVNKKKK